jgi:hypothetical protein
MQTIIIIIFVAGSLGGVTNFLNTKLENDGWLHFWRCLISGIAAAFVVPLFLQMIQSALLEQLPESHPACLVFAGFCILAAVSSRGFLDGLAKKALRLAEENSRKTDKIKTKVEELSPILAKETEGNIPTGIDPSSVKLDGDPVLSSKPLAVLNALLNPSYTFRTIEGLKKESKLSTEEEVNDSLRSLKSSGYANQSTRNNTDYWYATAKGRSILKAPNPTNLYSEPPK